ncbi:asparagine synthase [Paenibacillus darwinianus]|uniref:asparagine synthase (glutamine-hydrolyzing) n=1 Tax=Paenibacillus darwinianus TaxID=1380763 RepID=A0A9W5S053_9BACL|nr:asparagine synthase (glutamine-hydrolyzing) [Paenibacillus darwinianus]EXX87933.1 asparagine synthase [Paenibacillus darwinianus]EXX88355.1 asparagine synthase [Paenibacillus darwinianus]EXX88395.1 asparagine synthase [Paenibacillus darwinianus]
MCGFVTVYNKNQALVSSDILQRMTDIIAHRGPDDQGIYVNDHVGLGFRRLSIIDIENGAQPLGNETQDVWLVFNGEIYNYRELREWLTAKGHQFRTQSDTEVILRLYEETGTDCPNYLRGMFGFTIWDKKRQLLFAARDPFGVKPVYYSETPYGYMIGSEIKSLFASGKLDREVNEDALYHYLTFQYVPEPATMFQSVSKLGAGHYMMIKDDKMTIKPYYSVQFNPDETRSFSDLAEEARVVLAESVGLHRNSDVPRGAFLSGGIDSSSLVGLLHRLEPTKTFSVGFDMPGYSELDEARKTAAYLGTEHHEIRISAQEYMDVLPALVWHMDEPVADPSAVGLYFVSKLASQHVKVVFSGEGADEFFGGYNIYREPHSLRMLQQLPDGLRKMTGFLAELMPAGMKGRSFLQRGSQTLQERFYGNAKIFADPEKKDVLSASFLADGFYRPTQAVTAPLYQKAEAYDDVTKMQYIDIHTWLRGNILMKADKMSMANSLELRVPFVDKEVFKFAAAIPTKYRVTPEATKVLLREAMKDVVPPDVQNRKKLGFPVPTRVWLRNEWYVWAKELIHTADVGKWINKSYALRLLELHKEGKTDASRKLWTLLVFMLWHQIYIEESLPSAWKGSRMTAASM